MNPATKISTLLIVTLSLLCSVESVICNSCEMAKNSKCFTDQGRCFADHGGACATLAHYSRGKHLYSQHLCVPNCHESETKKEENITYAMCCYKNLCNAL